MRAMAEVQRGPVRTIRREDKVKAAIDHWAKECEWPRWFAKNVVLWRKAQGYQWMRCLAKEMP